MVASQYNGRLIYKDLSKPSRPAQHVCGRYCPHCRLKNRCPQPVVHLRLEDRPPLSRPPGGINVPFSIREKHMKEFSGMTFVNCP